MINLFYDLSDIGVHESEDSYWVELECYGISFEIHVFPYYDRYECIRFDSGLMMHRGIGNPSYVYAIYRGLSRTYMESYSHGIYESIDAALDTAWTNLEDYVSSSYFANLYLI